LRRSTLEWPGEWAGTSTAPISRAKLSPGHRDDRERAMNLEAFDNLQRVLRSVPEHELRMENWNDCAIGHACRDPWFQQRILEQNFNSTARVFGIRYSEALFLFSVKAGKPRPRFSRR
jgi:hypothetical protein